MPEGPEIRLAADKVGEALINKRTAKVWFAFDHLKHYEPVLSGDVVTAVKTRGKAMLTEFASGHTIYSHNQLYGVWMVRDAYAYPETKRQLRLNITNGMHSALLYSASDIEVWDSAEIDEHPFLKKLGPELLDETVTLDTIVARFTDPKFQRRSLAALLLDQHFLSGLGNYLRSEILFVAGVNPRARLGDVSAEKHHALAKASLDITRQSYRTKGITIDETIYKRQKKAGVGRRHARWWVFAREGMPCHNCGTPIVKEMIGGRRLYYCPQEQI